MAYDQQNAYRSQAGGRASAADIDEGLRSYMLRVYNFMAIGLAWTAVVSLFVMSDQALMREIFTSLGGWGKWILFGAIIAMGWFSPKLLLSGNTPLAYLSFGIYASLWGIWISPMVWGFVAKGNSGIVFQAFAITSAMFLALSLFGYVTKKNLSGIATFCGMGLLGLFVIGLIAVFTGGFANNIFSFGFSALVVLLIAGMTAYETQAIKEMYFEGDTRTAATGKAIFGAFHLYTSFIVMFIHILNMLGILSGDD